PCLVGQLGPCGQFRNRNGQRHVRQQYDVERVIFTTANTAAASDSLKQLGLADRKPYHFDLRVRMTIPKAEPAAPVSHQAAHRRYSIPAASRQLLNAAGENGFRHELDDGWPRQRTRYNDNLTGAPCFVTAAHGPEVP